VSESVTAGQQLGSVLKVEAAHNPAALLVWALQRPEQLRTQETRSGEISFDTVTGVGSLALAVLKVQLSILEQLPDSSAAQLTSDFTKQLKQSGEQE
jgi:hypothetical protein